MPGSIAALRLARDRDPGYRRGVLRFILNVLWLVLSGFWLAIAYIVAGLIMCITIIGIPLGIADFKMAGAALVPFGREIVSLPAGTHAPAGMITVDTRSREERA